MLILAVLIQTTSIRGGEKGSLNKQQCSMSESLADASTGVHPHHIITS